MSTIKSSSEHLTLNADGSGNDIKFQSNGVEKASIDQDGLVTCAGSTMSGALTVNSGANLAFKVNGTTYTQLWQTLQSPNDLTLKTTADKYISFQPNSVEKVRIHSSGVTSFNNGIELGSGLDATAANTLDDYEEGTWTPTILASLGTNPTVSGTLSGTYTKIGNRVTLSFQGDSISVSGTTNGNLKFGGLPFSNSDDGKSCGTWTTYLVDFVRPNMAGVLTNLSDGIGCLSTADDASWGWELVNIMDGGTSFRASYSYLTTS